MSDDELRDWIDDPSVDQCRFCGRIGGHYFRCRLAIDLRLAAARNAALEEAAEAVEASECSHGSSIYSVAAEIRALKTP